jgi:zinc/manganese transport system substrate-binding protein
MNGRRATAALLAAATVAAALVGCSAAAGESADILIVASTDVYAAIAQQLVAGLPPGRVGVSAIIGDPSIDPHEYEASARNELAISRADLIIENGGGYDDFVDLLRRAAGSSAPVINAVDIFARAADAGIENEHVWYDFPNVARVASRITAFLIVRDRADAATLRRNAAHFAGELHQLEAAEARIRALHAGAGVAITESVPAYLLIACGLVDRTPAEFSHAIEEGTDASPRVVQDTLDLFSAHRVKLLVYNAQTAGPQTDQVISAAKDNGVPIVPVTETLPGSISYVRWMRGILHDVAAALA